MLNFSKFDAIITRDLFRGSLPDWQRAPVHALLNEGFERQRRQDEVANVLAQCYHETGRFKYTHEIGKGEGRVYGEPVLLIRGKSEVYYGRGWIQTTWLSNYAKASIKASLAFKEELDFVNNPDLIVSRMDVQAWYVWEGFITGMWTGKNLADFWVGKEFDHVNARAIVNGDVSKNGPVIAGYAYKFREAIQSIEKSDSKAPTACPLAECPIRSA